MGVWSKGSRLELCCSHAASDDATTGVGVAVTLANSEDEGGGLVVTMEVSEGLVVATEVSEGLVVTTEEGEGLVVTMEEGEGLVVTMEEGEDLVVAMEEGEGLVGSTDAARGHGVKPVELWTGQGFSVRSSLTVPGDPEDDGWLSSISGTVILRVASKSSLSSHVLPSSRDRSTPSSNCFCVGCLPPNRAVKVRTDGGVLYTERSGMVGVPGFDC